MNTRWFVIPPWLFFAVWIATATATIDPVLVNPTPQIRWTRQFGANGFDQANAVGYGEFGVYTAGFAIGAFAGQASAGNTDAFVSLHDEAGNVKWIRQFGTDADDVATGVAGDGSGAYVVGYTGGALDSQIGAVDSFLRKYDPDGNVLWTHQFGTVADDRAYGVATHTSGVYVVGAIECCGTSLPGLPPTAGTDAYIKKYSGDGAELWIRMISAENTEVAYGVAVDDTGVYVVGSTNSELVVGQNGGRDGFLRKYSHDGAQLWTKQFGTVNSAGDAATDDAFAVAVGAGGVFVAGATATGSIPGGKFVGGLWDAFLIRFDPADGNPQWYRQIGTDGDDYARGVAVGAGHVLVTGETSSNLVDGAYVGGSDAFLRLYDLDGNELGTSQFGDGLNDSVNGAVAFPGGFFVSGTKSGSALEQEVAGDNDSFVMKVIPPPFVPVGAVLNAASLATGGGERLLAPGSMAVVSGAYLNDGPQVLSPVLDGDGKVATTLGGTRVLVNNIPAPILHSIATQVAFQVPFELAGQSAALVVVQVGGQFSLGRAIGIAPAAPGIFTQNLAGTGAANAVHEDGVTTVTPQNPAKRNELVTIQVTGLGVLNPALGTGVAGTGSANLAQAQVTLAFGTVTAAVEYAGAAPGSVGVNQIRARVPLGAPTGGDVPISLVVDGRPANAATIAIGQ